MLKKKAKGSKGSTKAPTKDAPDRAVTMPNLNLNAS